MNEEILALLETTGLSKLEAIVYINGLKSGPISMAKLAVKLGLSRQTVYEIIKKLQKKDLAVTNQKDYGKKVYMAKLEEVEQYIEKKKKQLELTKNSLKKLAFQFPLKNTKLPAVRFFEGRSALKKTWLEILEVKNKKIYNLMSVPYVMGMLGPEFNNYFVEQRIKRGIQGYSIRMGDPKDDKTNHSKEIRQVRYLSPKLYDITSLFCIFDDKVLIMASQTEAIGLIIESEEISKSLLNIWKILWTQAKEA
jgi:sugar-specific transcriptional regulator TrmB